MTHKRGELQAGKQFQVETGPLGEAHLFALDVGFEGVRSHTGRIAAVSLDVFDTLIFRSCQSPQQVFIETANRGLQIGALSKGLFPSQFRDLRIFAESEARRQQGKDPTLDAVYALLPAGIGDRARLREIELEVESSICYLNPSAVGWVKTLKNEKVPVILVSDTYLTETELRSLLQRLGLPLKAEDIVLVSSKRKATKASGTLFQSLLALHPQLKPEEILHIGDNLQSDCRQSLSAGISGVLYSSSRQDPAGIFDFEEIFYSPILGEIRSLRALAGSLCTDVDPLHRPWYRAGAMVLGPFWAAVADWALDVAVDERADGIFPLMREAHGLVPLLKQAAKHRCLQLRIAPLYASRMVSELAILDTAEPDYYGSFFKKIALTVGDLLLQLGSPAGSEFFQRWKDVPLTDAWSKTTEAGMTVHAALTRFLDRSETRVSVAQTVETHRSLMGEYLLGVLGDSKRAVTMDIGYRGTIQKAIQRLLKPKSPNTSLVHLMAWSRGHLARLWMQNIDIRTFSDASGEDAAQVDSVLGAAMLLEQALIGEGGSVAGYRSNPDGRTVPILRPDPFSKEEHAKRAALRLGMERYQRLWLELRAKQPQRITSILSKRHEWNCLIQRLVEYPTFEEAMALGQMHHDVNAGSGAVFPLCPLEEEELARKNGVSAYARSNRKRLEPAVWTAGVVTRVDPAAHFRGVGFERHRGYFGSMLRFCSKIMAQGCDRVAVYGAGEVGQQFLRAARLLGPKPTFFVDRNRKLWGSHIEGIEIVSLEEAVNKGASAYAVASFAFIDEIQQAILQACAGANFQPAIFVPD
jgi:FMN phosphatase YigB (HAD superfamily)